VTDLSPAAQAVLDAFLDSPVDVGNYYATRSRQIAVALRAAADQVVPENLRKYETYTNEAIRLNRMHVRAEVLAIAAELEAVQ
jgi:uncharacterized protein (UPF0147 family)